MIDLLFLSILAGLAGGYLTLAIQESDGVALLARRLLDWPVDTFDDLLVFLCGRGGGWSLLSKLLGCPVCLAFWVSAAVLLATWFIAAPASFSLYPLSAFAAAGVGVVLRVVVRS